MNKVISIASSKGGAGKTTTSFLLGSELAAQGIPVCIIDADPNHPIVGWEQRGGNADNLSIIQNKDENSVMDEIDEAKSKNGITIVDLEGVANMTAAYAICRSDFVIIPSQRSALDTDQAAKTISLIKQQEKVSGRKIPFSLVIARTSQAIRSRGLKTMYDNCANQDIDIYLTEINDREAYKAIFDYNKTLGQLTHKEVGGLENSRQNASDFAAETMRKIKGQSKKDIIDALEKESA